MNAAARKVVLTAHARAQALRRGLSETTVLNIAQSPEERIALRLGREIRQSRLRRQGGKLYLIRLVVDSAPDEDQVVTAYCTSKIDKYWSGA